MDEGKRWLNAGDVATYVGVRVDQIPRYVRAGKLPLPSYHFGPRSPRWDRLALDAAFEGSPSKGAKTLTTEELVDGILNGGLLRRRPPPTIAERKRLHKERLRMAAEKKAPPG
jgi:hypothetical protein